MIRILDDWGIDVDNASRCYMVGRIRKNKDKKTGEEVECLYEPAYLNDFAQALYWLYRRLRRDAIQSADGTLKAAIQAIQASDRRLEAAVRDAGLEGK